MSAVPHILLFVGACFIGSLGVAGGALLLSRLFAGNASRRHLVFVAAFAALLALPLVAAMVPPQLLLDTSATQAVPPPPVAMPAVPAVRPHAVAATPAPVHRPIHRFDMADGVIGLLALWGVGLAWFALRGAFGAFAVMRLNRASVPYRCDGVDLEKLTGTCRRWRLRLSTRPGGIGPVTWGYLRPVVLLPKAAVRWPAARLEAVFLHEIAHMRRADSLTMALARLACALYWPNPLVWRCARLMRRDAEIAADDSVLRAGIKPSVYAEELLCLASEFRRGYAGPFPAMAASALETRLRSVLSPTQSRNGVSAMDAMKYAGAGLAAALLLACARPAFAEDVTPPAPPTPPAAPEAVAAPAKPHVQVITKRKVGKPGETAQTQTVTVQMKTDDANVGTQADMVKPEIRVQIAAAREQAKAAKAQARVALEQVRPQVRQAIEMAMRMKPGVSDAEIKRTIDEAMGEIDKALEDLDREDVE